MTRSAPLRLKSPWVSKALRVAGICGLAAAGDLALPLAQEYVVVVSPDVTVSDITLDGLRDVYTFRRRFWKAAQPIHILYSSESFDDDSILLRRIYGMQMTGLRRLIMENINRGNIDFAPKVVSTDEIALRFVERGKGLIALIRRSDTGRAGNLTLSIDGKKPGDPDYPLRR